MVLEPLSETAVSPVQRSTYGDPLNNANSAFIERLKELKQLDLETARQEQM